MVSIVPSSRPPPPEAQPAWDIGRLFPPQGYWDERDYLALETNHLVEFTDGCIRVLPLPDMAHQSIVGFLVDQLSYALSDVAKLVHLAMPAPLC